MVKFQIVLTNSNCKIFFWPWKKTQNETCTLLRLFLIKFLSSRILQRIKGTFVYGEWGGPVWPLGTIWDCSLVLLFSWQRACLCPCPSDKGENKNEMSGKKIYYSRTIWVVLFSRKGILYWCAMKSVWHIVTTTIVYYSRLKGYVICQALY